MFFRKRRQQDFHDEISAHLELEMERLRAEGLSEDEARLAALRAFGNVTSSEERYYESNRWLWADQFMLDVRYAIRALRRSKAFAATAVLTLGVGLGLNTVLFTLLNAYVLRPFAVKDPYNLYEISYQTKDKWDRFYTWNEYQDLRGRKELFDDVIAERITLASSGGRNMFGVLVSGNYFNALGASMQMGRSLNAADTSLPGSEPVVVLSNQAWRSIFGQDPAILGRKIELNGHTFEVVGVTRPEFTGLNDLPPDFWVPVTMIRAVKNEDVFASDQPRLLYLVGRLRRGITPEQCRSALTGFAARVTGKDNARAGLRLKSTPIPFSPALVKVFSPVFAVFILVLIAACANVSNMMLARTIARQREIGVRLSIGAGRGRLVRQLLTEGLLIALLAGIVGMTIAVVTLDLGQRLLYLTIPTMFASVIRIHPLNLDYRVFFFVLTAAAAATLLFALAPALQATRVKLMDAMRGETGLFFRVSTLRNALVISQVTVCLALLISAATLYRNSDTFQTADVGFDTHEVITVFPGEKLFPATVEKLKSDPRVGQTAVVRFTPLNGRLPEILVTPESSTTSLRAGHNLVSHEYFSLLAVPIRTGRSFTPEEARSEAPVAVISELTAKAFWPGQDPVGRTFRVEKTTERGVMQLPQYSEVTVIGVAKDVINGWVGEGVDSTCIYLPSNPHSKNAHGLLVRGNNPGSLPLAVLYRILQTIRPDVLAFEPLPLEQTLALQIYPFRVATWIGSVLAFVALALTISGMYGVLAYMVNQRTKEIGIRMALGATAGSVMGLILRHSMRLTAIGLMVGLLVSAGVVKLLSAAVPLRNISFTDPRAFAAGLLMVVGSVLLASFFPSRRAGRVDPSTTLRSE